MSTVQVTDRQRIVRMVETAWIQAAAFAGLFVFLAIWGTPHDWFYTLLGLPFLVIFAPVVIYSVRFGVLPFLWTLVGAWTLQGLVSVALIPVERLGGGAEFVMQLCISAAGTYLILFLCRKQILRWSQ